MEISIINGPNLNLLGSREVEIYGNMTLNELEKRLKNYRKNYNNLELYFFQSNCEGKIIDKIAETKDYNIDGIIINPAAYTHTSVAIYDAIKAVDLPAVEVHLSNINKREDFRKESLIAGACSGQISGFGYKSYELALSALVDIINY